MTETEKERPIERGSLTESDSPTFTEKRVGAGVPVIFGTIV